MNCNACTSYGRYSDSEKRIQNEKKKKTKREVISIGHTFTEEARTAPNRMRKK